MCLRSRLTPIAPGWIPPASSVCECSAALPQPESLQAESGWLESWRGPDETATSAIEQTLGSTLSEPLVARALAAALPESATLYVASSMPIRDLESFQGTRDDPPKVLSNRGANGIDGTVSSAFGAAAAQSDPVVLLTGDLALLHDMTGLLAARRLGLQVTIVVLNNNGGGIFHFLPLATQQDAFEEHVATPHGLDFSRVANLFEFEYVKPETVDQFRHALTETAAAKIIEIRTDRAENRELHRRLSPPAAAAAPRA